MQKDLQGKKKLPQVKYGLFKTHIGTWDGSFVVLWIGAAYSCRGGMWELYFR